MAGEADAVDVPGLAASLSPELVQLWYQMAVTGRRDLGLAPSPRTGFEMTLLRMLAFRPAGEGGGLPAAAPRRRPPPQCAQRAAGCACGGSAVRAARAEPGSRTRSRCAAARASTVRVSEPRMAPASPTPRRAPVAAACRHRRRMPASASRPAGHRRGLAVAGRAQSACSGPVRSSPRTAPSAATPTACCGCRCPTASTTCAAEGLVRQLAQALAAPAGRATADPLRVRARRAPAKPCIRATSASSGERQAGAESEFPVRSRGAAAWCSRAPPSVARFHPSLRRPLKQRNTPCEATSPNSCSRPSACRKT